MSAGPGVGRPSEPPRIPTPVPPPDDVTPIPAVPAGTRDRRVERAASVPHALNYAFEGIIHVLRTQRNMRIHFALAFVALLGGLALGASRAELIALVFAGALVIVMEMINTAIEAAIDVATSSFDPRAKVAKDVAAGAVLVSAVCALAVAYFVFADRLARPSSTAVTRVRESPLQLTVIALVVVVLTVIVVKAVTGRGTPMQGGLPSGHAAIAFAGWAAILFVTSTYAHHVLIDTIAFLMAALVAQTRVEAGIHSPIEVIYGAIVGTLVTLMIFQLWS